MDTLKTINLTFYANFSSVNSTLELIRAVFWSEYQSRFTAWYTLTILLCFLLGFFNVLCVLVIYKTRALRTGAGALMAHMIFIESITCLITLPVWLTLTFIHLTTTLTCRIFQFFFAVVNIAVYFNILILAINRFVAIIFPLSYRQFTQPRWIKTFISLIWMISVVVNIPMEFVGGVGHFGIDRVWGGCAANLIRPGQPDYRSLHIILAMYSPLALTGVLYIFILLKARTKTHHTDVSPAEPSGDAAREARVYRRKMNMSYLLFFSFLAYCVLFLSFPLVTRSIPKAVVQFPMIVLWMVVVFTFGHAVHSVSKLKPYCMNIITTN